MGAYTIYPSTIPRDTDCQAVTLQKILQATNALVGTGLWSGGHGAPASDPSTTTSAQAYLDYDTDDIYVWNPINQQWVLSVAG